MSLTRPQWAILEFLRDYIPKNPTPPSFDQIATAMGWSSKSHVGAHLAALAAQGFIRWRRGVSRSIELADGPIMLRLDLALGRLVAMAADREGKDVADFIAALLRSHLVPERSVSRDTSQLECSEARR